MILAPGSTVLADDYVWAAPPVRLPYATSQSWFNTNHWLPTRVPDAMDRAIFFSGSAQLNGSVNVGTISMNGAELQGPGPLRVNDINVRGLNWFVDAAALNYTNYADGDFRYHLMNSGDFSGKFFTNIKWENYAQTVVSSAWFVARGSLYKPSTAYGAQWKNRAGSQMTLIGSNYFTFENRVNSPVTEFLHELGAVLRKRGTNASRIDWPLRSEGTIVVEQGELGFQFAKNLNGPVNIEPGATLRFDTSDSDLHFGPGAAFNGQGRLVFYGSNNATNFAQSQLLFNPPVIMTNVNLAGVGAIFVSPVLLRNTTLNIPVQFLLGGRFEGTIQNSMLNHGILTDAGIRSVPGAVNVNIAPGYYYASNSVINPTSYQGTNQARFGWFTNTFGANLHFQKGPSVSAMHWNIHNNGYLRFDPGIRVGLPGTLAQGPVGHMDLAGNSIIASAHIILDGRVTGWGGITSHNAHVSCTLSPHGSNSAFGRLEIYTQNNIFTAFPTNRLTFTPETVLELDLGAPGTSSNDYIHVSGPNQSLAGTLNIRAQEGFGPGTYPIMNTTGINLRFGSVPAGYRYSFATNKSTFELSVVVSQPELPLAQLQVNQPGGTNQLQLTLNTLSNVNYTIDFTDSLFNQPWQRWTNIIGTGGPVILPVTTTLPTRFFRVTQGP